MTDHFKKSLAGIGLVSIILFGLFIWMKRRIEKAVTIPSLPASKSHLMPNDREYVEFNEKTHHVTVTTSSGTVKMYARDPGVHVKKDGRVIVDRHLFGFEATPFIGIGFSDTTRGMLGVEPLYWGPFDASLSLGISLDKQYTFAKPYVAVGYNCWENMSVNAGVNPVGIKQLDVILFLSVKL